jgi:ribosomal L7/L12-like protein
MIFAQAVIDEIKQGNKIQAIKLFREANGTGLKEAKIAVETYISTHPDIKVAFYRNKAGGVSQERVLQIVILLAVVALALLITQ